MDSVIFAVSSEAEESILFLVKVMICLLSYNELDVVCANMLAYSVFFHLKWFYSWGNCKFSSCSLSFITSSINHRTVPCGSLPG